MASGDLSSRLKAVAAGREVEQAQRSQKEHPKGWEPGIEFDSATGTGTITSEPTGRHPNWESIIEAAGLDPAEYEVLDDTVQFRTWSGFAKIGKAGDEEIVKVPLYYYKADIRRRRGTTVDADFTDLVREIKKWKRPKRDAPEGDLGFVFNIADLQLGKGDGDGVEGTITRILDGFAAVATRYRELRRIGRKFSTLYICDVGDPIEGCHSNYPGQQFTVQLNRRDQGKLYRRLIIEAVKMMAGDFERVVVLTVPSNHGEHRQNGKKVTDDGDDEGLALMEQIHDVVRENPDLAHVSFVIPSDEMVVELDVHGTVIAWTHSHKAERAGSGGMGVPQGKVKTWWEKASFGGLRGGDADVLVTGHYHHFSAIDHGGEGVGLGRRLHLQCPSQDPGSKWWRDMTGAQSGSGFLTFVAGGGAVRDIQVV